MTIKRQLQLLLPGVCVFLDVDNLESIDDLESEVEASQAVLVMHGSVRYFTSANCMRELAAARRLHVPLIHVHESDPNKNGAALPTLRAAATRRLTSADVEHLYDHLSAIVPWTRIAAFQQLSIALIAEQLLLASPAYEAEAEGGAPLYMKQALAWAEPSFSQPVALYTSVRNEPAAQRSSTALSSSGGSTAREVAMATRAAFDEISVVSELPELALATASLGTVVKAVAWASKLKARAGVSRLPTSFRGESTTLTRWLLVVSPTCFEGEAGDALAREVAAALALGIQPLVVYEPDIHEFREILDATPRSLVLGGLYGPLAIEWRAGPLRAVSVRMVAKELGARMHPPFTAEAGRYRFLAACRRCLVGGWAWCCPRRGTAPSWRSNASIGDVRRSGLELSTQSTHSVASDQALEEG